MHKSFLFTIKLIFLLIFVCPGLKAQDRQLKQAFDFPSKEIYDLHVDKHGFLWIASNFGVARYDGINCVYYSSPRQISLGCTNLLEDNYGRMWFNDFNGQIFYIEHETVTLAESYKYKNEGNFPRMVLFHDQLLATSDKGLFVLNTQNLTGKYITNNIPTTSLTILKNQVLVHGSQTWFLYNDTTGLKKINYVGDQEIRGNNYILANKTYHDTVYMTCNPSGIVKKLLVQNDTVKQYQQINFNSYINTISISAGNQWINTDHNSYSLANGEQIKGYNLSSIVTDLEGNNWFSSLYYGLLIQQKKDIANKTIVPDLDKDDLVVSIKNYKDKLLLGTQKGFLILYDPASKTTGFKIKIAAAAGAIYSITAVDQDNYIIASFATYIINIPGKKVTKLSTITTVKQVCYDDKAIYIASASGLFAIPREKSEKLNHQIMDAFGHVFQYDAAENYFFLRTRSRAITYFPDQASLFVTFKNGLFKIDKNGIKPFMFNNEQVYAASLAYVDHRLYVGTISNGMLIVEKSGIKHISVQSGLFSKSIFKIKPIDKNLWIVGSGPLQIFNTEKRALVDNYEFPDQNVSQVFDLDGVGETIYLATSSSLDNFPLVKNSAGKKLKNYLLYVKVNNEIATENASQQLSYSKNNVLFNIGVPAYLKAKDIYIKYCLVTKTDSTWLTTEPGERAIRFSSLMPGTYTLKAIAVDPRLGMADTMIKYDFTIAEPWWGGIGFKLFLVFVFLLIILYGYVSMLRKRLSLKQAFDTQQELILAERQRISAEIHDDIGSGIFAIQSLADVAGKNENAGPEIVQIKNMISDLSVKIREVIWSTNVGNDNLENLFYYTHFQINKLFEYSKINFISELPDDIPNLKITGENRRTIYLLIKELVHNAIKHSNASTIELKMYTDEQALYIAVDDNGVGINPDNARPKGMGLGNIRSRVEKLNGSISIENNSGAHINIKIPLKGLQAIEFDKKLNKWPLLITGLLKSQSNKQKGK